MALKCLLLIMGLCAPFCSALDDECTQKLFGQRTPEMRILDPVALTPNEPIKSININLGCPQGTAGVLVEACDDIAPDVSLDSIDHVTVVRRGYWQYHTGIVYMTEYCLID